MEKQRGVVIIGHNFDAKARAAILAAQGYEVELVSPEEAKKRGINFLEEKLNVIDKKHLKFKQQKEFNQFTHESKYHK